MKNIIKTLVVVMVVVLTLTVFTACDLFTPTKPTTPTTPTECTHEGGKATCTKPAVCELCGEIYGEALGHKSGFTTAQDPTCTKTGISASEYCSVCGEILVAATEIPATGHKFKDGKCEVCEEEDPDYVPPHEHTWADVEGKEPTCTEAGYTAHQKCECGETQGKTEIEALEHTNTEILGYGATCLKDGLTAGIQCSVCGEIIKAQEKITKTGHDWNEGETANNITVYACNTCGVRRAESANFENKDNIIGNNFVPTTDAANQVWSPEFGYNSLTDGIKTEEAVGRFSTKPAAIFDATLDLGQKYVLDTLRIYLYDTAWANHETQIANKPLTLGNDMLIQVYAYGEWHDVIVCENNEALCEYWIEVEGENNDYLAFDLNGIVVEKIRIYISGTYQNTSISYQEIECSGAFFNEHVHTEEVLEGYSDCLKNGLTEGAWCPVCKEVLKEQEVILASGHDWDEGVTENDITTYTCKACGIKKSFSDLFNAQDNVFNGKTFVGLGDGANNYYNANYAYSALTDGIIYQEGVGRYSSKMNGGKVEAILDLGGEYALSEFKVYLYWQGIAYFGTGMEIYVLSDGEWKTVVYCSSVEELQAYWVDNTAADQTADKDWLIFDLGGVVGTQIKFVIPDQTGANTASTFYEIECSGASTTIVAPDEPQIIENILLGKAFVPTSEAEGYVYNATFGYASLTDGMKISEAPGRFSTQSVGIFDATVDLGGVYALSTLKFYLYDTDWANNASQVAKKPLSLGKDLLIQVYANGEWKDVIFCENNEALCEYWVEIAGSNNDYVEFNLNGVVAEKIRIYISGTESNMSITYQEFECSGYAQ